MKQHACLSAEAVEAAFRAVPRHLFLPGIPLDKVYADEAIPTKFRDGLPISSSSQPAVMATMLEQLDVQAGHHILEIGAGTGYNAALLATLAGEGGQPLLIQGNVQQLVAFERTDTHLLSVSVRPGSFMPLCGVGADPHSYLSLGPVSGLNLALGDEPRAVDPDAVYALVVGPHVDRLTPLRVSQEDLWSGIGLWLALHAPTICHLTAIGPSAERNLVPDLLGGSSTFHTTLGLFEETTLCVLMRSSDNAPSQEPSPETLSWPLLIRRFGPNEQLAERLLQYLVAWETAGRPSSTKSRIRVYPQKVSYVPQASEVVVAKRWSRLVFDWP